MKKIATKTIDGKEVEQVIHDDGSKDVHITVRGLSVNETTPEGRESARVINEEIIPGLKQSKVHVVVICKLDDSSCSRTVNLPEVRNFAEKAAWSYIRMKQMEKAGQVPTVSDFLVVEIHEGSNLTRVSKLINL